MNEARQEATATGPVMRVGWGLQDREDQVVQSHGENRVLRTWCLSIG